MGSIGEGTVERYAGILRAVGEGGRDLRHYSAGCVPWSDTRRGSGQPMRPLPSDSSADTLGNMHAEWSCERPVRWPRKISADVAPVPLKAIWRPRREALSVAATSPSWGWQSSLLGSSCESGRQRELHRQIWEEEGGDVMVRNDTRRDGKGSPCPPPHT